MRNLRKKVKRWAINVNVDIRKAKLNLMGEYDKLDLLQETTRLGEYDRDRMKAILEELMGIWKNGGSES